MKRCCLVILSLILILFSGCSSLNSRKVAIDSYGIENKLGPKKYYLSSHFRSNNILQQKELEYEIEKMLINKGYMRVYDIQMANLIVEYNYLLKGPLYNTYSSPVPVERWDRFYNRRYYRPRTIWVDQVFTEVYFEKKLTLKSMYKDTKYPLWEIEGIVRDSQEDIRESFPYILKGIQEYIGINTGKVIYIDVSLGK